jgi:hypothetical protein
VKTEQLLVYGGIGLAAFIGSYYFFKSKSIINKVYDMGPAIADPDPFVLQQLEEAMPTRTLTDDYVQTYNRWINGYREKPTMFPENYYELPFRYDWRNPDSILTSPGVPDSFGSNPINPEPNYWDRWIRQSFSF